MKRNVAVYLFLFLSAIYVLLVMLLPTDPATLARYDITESQARVLNLTVVVPLMGIWYMALQGFIRFRGYAKTIRTTKEGWAFTLLSCGLMFLAFGLPLNSIFSALLTYVSAQDKSFLPTATILRNYFGLMIALLSFLLLARGAILLVISHKDKTAYRPVLPLFIVPAIILISSLFTWLVVTSPTGPESETGYYLPNWLIIFTIVVPYLIAWLGGFLALFFLNIYRTKVRGTIYKGAFGELAIGIGVVTLISVVLQLLTTISSQINRLRLTPILLIVYVLVILYAVGFWYIARGSKKLQTFEEA